MSVKITSLTRKTWNVECDEVYEIDKSNSQHFLWIFLRNRNIADAQAFIGASIKTCLPDPYTFINMEKAVKRLAEAIKNKEKITILGDYDVDGVSSVAIMVNFLTYVGTNVSYSIPDRSEEGYGLNVKSIEENKESLIVAVDCGSGSVTELDYAKKIGVDVIVIDHHKMMSVPSAFAIINPHRPDEIDDYKRLCATGLVFICIVGLNRFLRESGFYDVNKSNVHIGEPNLMDYVDLVALATVCDVMEMTGLNRAFVKAGLKIIQMRKNVGINAMIAISRKISVVTAETIAFFLGPRINAAGRILSAEISVRLLTTKNPVEARALALQLEELNRERQIMEVEVLEEATNFADENLNFVCAYSSKWHIGIIGIVAGRLKEKFNKPSIVISLDLESGIGKASCRSIPEVDISEIINKGIKTGVILSGGGHYLAAGFSIKNDRIDDLITLLKTEITYRRENNELYADCFLTISTAISKPFIQMLAKMEPYGTGNRYPKFVIKNVEIISPMVVGRGHIQALLDDGSGKTLRIISFKSYNTTMGDIIFNYK
ncbi:MAG: single-stranded-DNA-specific exonuclease RecJ, partial [Holosporaceae bacterium]|nr:single-stranded-DNA-specific exonuclease RecJ [Holosporaceae bacterium]